MAKVEKLISGAQTGADMGGLLAAEELGIPTGGHVPRGCLTEKGRRPELMTRFNLTETDSTGYPERTKLNVQNADVTIIFAPILSQGSQLTKDLADRLNKPCLVIEFDITLGTIDVVKSFIKKHNPKIINIAGNRESKTPGVEHAVYTVMFLALQTLHREHEAAN